MAANPKYLLGFTVNGNAAAKAASLTGSGMMNAPAAHWFSNAWTFLQAGTQGGTKGVSMKQIAYVYFESLIWDDDMLNKSIPSKTMGRKVYLGVPPARRWAVKPRWEVASEPMAHVWDQYDPYLYALHTLQQSGADANGSNVTYLDMNG